MRGAYKTLPVLSKKKKEDWMTDELLNLSKKRKDAWLLLCGVGKSDDSLKLKYHHLYKLTKAAAEKSRNAWYNACAPEAEKRAWAAEQRGHVGSLVWEPSTSTLLARDGSNLTRDDDKLQHWMEHFSDTINCESEDSMATSYAFPILKPPSALSDGVYVNELSDNLTEEEIAAAISQMKKGRAPGLDGIATEMFKLGGAILSTG